MRLVLPLLFLVGCSSSYDAVLVQATDYTLDRGRVPAVRLSSDVVSHTEPLQIDALVLHPEGLEPSRIELAVCGLRDDVPVSVGDVRCFDNPDLVQVIGDRLPLRWTPPDRSAVGCSGERFDVRDTADTGVIFQQCTSRYPLRVAVEWPDGQRANGHVVLEHTHDPDSSVLREAPSFSELDQQLVIDGEVAPGQTLDLHFAIEPAEVFRGFYWYVDQGELLQTGVTRAQRLEGGRLVTDNQLRLPSELDGPLRVVVVFDNPSGVGDVTWVERALEVP